MHVIGKGVILRLSQPIATLVHVGTCVDELHNYAEMDDLNPLRLVYTWL